MASRVPLVLTAGFRLFFFAAAISSLAAMSAWMAWIAIHAMNGVVTDPTIDVAPHYWHGHEMIFGYAVAVIAGFFLTAVPSWTGEKEARWIYVSTVAAIWFAGRTGVWLSAWINPWIVAFADLAFIPFLAFRIARNLVKRPKPQNVALLGILALIFCGNLLTHIEWTGLTDDTAERGLWLALFAVCALITIIGGRVTPAFTRNVLVRRGVERGLPVSRTVFQRAGISSAVLIGPLYALGAPEWLLGIVALLAALANGARLAGWRGRATLSEPILWALHLGFAMLVIGYALLALAWLTGKLHPIAAMHGLAIGAVGTMTMAVMTRAALGHTGRALKVAPAIAIAYLLIPVAMAVRVAGPELFPGWDNETILASGVLWLGAYVIFLAVYWPVLTGPDARPVHGEPPA